MLEIRHVYGHFGETIRNGIEFYHAIRRGRTVMTDGLRDQAALHGVLAQIEARQYPSCSCSGIPRLPEDSEPK